MIESNRRRLLAVTCFLGIAALNLYTVLSTAARGDAAPSSGAIAMTGFIAVLNTGLMAGAAFGISQLVRRKADRMGLVGAAFTILGASVSARIMVLIQLSMLSTESMRTEIGKLLESAPLVFVSIIPIGLTYPIGLILLGIALFLALPVNRWLGLLLAIAGVLFPVGRAVGVDAAIYACDLLLAATFALLAWQVLQRREVWEAA